MKTEYRGLVITGTPEEMYAFAQLLEQPKAEPELKKEEPKKPSKPKRDLDMGKVRALRDAGWSLDQIAVEMHCSPQTIANRLKGEADV